MFNTVRIPELCVIWLLDPESAYKVSSLMFCRLIAGNACGSSSLASSLTLKNNLEQYGYSYKKFDTRHNCPFHGFHLMDCSENLVHFCCYKDMFLVLQA